MAAGNQADIFHPYTGWLQFYVDEWPVEEIDTSKLTNWTRCQITSGDRQLTQTVFRPVDWGFTLYFIVPTRFPKESIPGLR